MARNSQISAFAQAAFQRVGEVIRPAGIHARAVRVVEGPMTITLYIGLNQPRSRHQKTKTLPQQMSMLVKLDQAIALRLGVEAVRIHREGSLYAIEIPHPAVWTPTANDLHAYGKGLRLPVGLDSGRKPVFFNLPKHPTVLWVGPPGRGKSESMRATASILASRYPVGRLEIYVASKKMHEWSQFERLGQTRTMEADTKQIYRLLDYLANAVMKARGAQGQTWPAILICVDDLSALIDEDRRIGGLVSRIATDGRALQMFLFAGVHAAGRKAGTGDGLLDQASMARLVYKPAKSGTAYADSGVTGLDVSALSDAYGDAYAIIGGTPRRCATAWRSDLLLESLATVPHYVEERTSFHHPAPAPTTLHRLAPAVGRVAPMSDGGVPSPSAPMVEVVQGGGATPVGPTEVPDPPAIETNRAPDKRERKLILDWILSLMATGEDVSQNRIVQAIYGKKCRQRNDHARSLLEEAQARLASAAPAAEPTRQLLGEDDEILRQMKSGEFDWSQVQGAW